MTDLPDEMRGLPDEIDLRRHRDFEGRMAGQWVRRGFLTLILLVVTGDLVQQGVTQNDQSITGALLAISTIGVLTVALSYASFRFKKLRPVLNGEPIVLVEDGEVTEPNLRRQRLTREEIGAEARLEGISSIGDVRWAILETNGRISFVTKEGGNG